MGRLAGKVALISGGARGQGATEAQLFCREDAKVVFGDVLDDDGRKVEAEIHAAGGEATYVHLNVTSEADWKAAVDTAVQRYGKLDILVNNAGILIRKGIEETTEDDWDRIMAVSQGRAWTVRHPARCGRRGSIINISSTAGLVEVPMAPLYTATKARCDSLPSRPPSSTLKTRSAATRCILVRLTLR
jgi:3alpha(or 20beta)-hydroxysteroid dehydrogenase